MASPSRDYPDLQAFAGSLLSFKEARGHPSLLPAHTLSSLSPPLSIGTFKAAIDAAPVDGPLQKILVPEGVVKLQRHCVTPVSVLGSGW